MGRALIHLPPTCRQRGAAAPRPVGRDARRYRPAAPRRGAFPLGREGRGAYCPSFSSSAASSVRFSRITKRPVFIGIMSRSRLKPLPSLCAQAAPMRFQRAFFLAGDVEHGVGELFALVVGGGHDHL